MQMTSGVPTGRPKGGKDRAILPLGSSPDCLWVGQVVLVNVPCRSFLLELQE